MTRRWLLPEHIEDVLPAEARAIERLRRAILDLFERHGYELVAPPLLEYVESLLSGTGRDLDLATFKLVDRLSGRMLGVRADHTPQVARIDAHLLNREGVARLCYCGSVLHTVPAGITRTREPLQIGAELYGHAGLEADIEIVRLMVEALRKAGLARIHVDLGNPAIYRALVAGREMDADAAEALFHAVQQKNAAEAGDLAVLTTLHGGLETLERARQVLPPAVHASLDLLEQVASHLDGVEVSIDLAELGGFNYESGLVFAAFSEGSPDAVARGGRYDQVGASFGRARPATGFTMDLRQLASLSRAPDERRAIVAPWSAEPAWQGAVARLRDEGHVVVVELPGHESARSELGCDRILEKKEGTWRVTSS